MSTEITQFEARAYKRLYELYRGTLLTIINMARNSVQYSLDDMEKLKERMQFIADEKKWDYSGIERKEHTLIIDELEKLLQ